MNVACRVYHLMHQRLYNKSNVCQVGVVLEHVDSCLHSALQGRNKYVLEIYCVQLLTVYFGLSDTNRVQTRVTSIRIGHDL